MFLECLCLGWLSFTELNLTGRMKTSWYGVCKDTAPLLSLSILALYMLFNICTKIILDSIKVLQGPR